MAAAVEMLNISKFYPGVIANSNVSLSVDEGQILGLIGENGAGKSTLMKILSGTYPYGTYEGEILYEGKAIQLTDVAVAQKYGIEMIYQEINMVMGSGIAENLYLGNLPGKGRLVDFKKLYAGTKEILERVGIDAKPTDKAAKLNSGQICPKTFPH